MMESLLLLKDLLETLKNENYTYYDFKIQKRVY